ncbi:MAG: hypothetical protein QME42_10965 [bacterium]|nr:hypothetical protein [bacterium]
MTNLTQRVWKIGILGDEKSNRSVNGGKINHRGHREIHRGHKERKLKELCELCATSVHSVLKNLSMFAPLTTEAEHLSPVH